jgi:hypothetical protein
MIAELFNIFYDSKEKRIRGSFIQITTLSILFSSYLLILFLIWHSVYVMNQSLADLTALSLGTFSSLAAVQSWNFTVYYRNRGRKPKVDE